MGCWIIKYVKTSDGSYTLYSKSYNQNFHSIKDGALSESYLKYIYPSFDIFKNNKTLNILDICFGIGYNTFATILYLLQNGIKTKVNFYAPELDEELIKSLRTFNYPKEFEQIKHIIDAISTKYSYEDEQFTISICLDDARKYIKTIENIDIVYQDAFSSDVNKELWTKEYFADISNILSCRAIVLTYSIATPIRLALWENNLYIYQYIYDGKRKATLSSNFIIENKNFTYINMKQKKINNPSATALKD